MHMFIYTHMFTPLEAKNKQHSRLQTQTHRHTDTQTNTQTHRHRHRHNSRKPSKATEWLIFLVCECHCIHGSHVYGYD